MSKQATISTPLGIKSNHGGRGQATAQSCEHDEACDSQKKQGGGANDPACAARAGLALAWIRVTPAGQRDVIWRRSSFGMRARTPVVRQSSVGWGDPTRSEPPEQDPSRS